MSVVNSSGEVGAILPTFFAHQHQTQDPASAVIEEPRRKWSGDVLRRKTSQYPRPPKERDSSSQDEKPGNGHVWDIWPITPRNVRRWDKPDPIRIAHIQIPAGSLAMNRRMDPLPEGWTMYIHPEGKPYYHRDAREPESNLLRGTPLYYNEKPLCRPLPIVTDSDPRNPITRKTLEHAHFITRVTVAENDLELPEHTELFLELYPDGEPGLHPYTGYYLADHDNQVVFWADQISTSDLDTHPVNPGTFADQHLKLQLGYQYWRHVECYPIDANIDIKQVEHALIEQLSFMSLDMATSDTSTAPWTEAQCQTYISVLHHTPASRKTWTVSRLMALTAYWQFRNFYGHPSARLDRTHSYEVEVKAIEPVAPAEQKQASKKMSSIKELNMRTFREKCNNFLHVLVAVVLRVCHAFLFEAPNTYNSILEQVWAHKSGNKTHFQYVMNNTIKDWGDISLLATVLWAVNMAFLAIPYPILPFPQSQPLSEFQRTIRIAMITACLASTVFSIGSVVISLLQIRKYRVEHPIHEFYWSLHTDRHQGNGYNPLAIIWSLPFAFLMWSILTFSVALVLFCITIGLPRDLVPKVPFLIHSGLILTSICLSIWYFWKWKRNAQ